MFSTKVTLGRALETANALFLELERRGHQVTFAAPGQQLHRRELDERADGGQERYGHGRWGPDRPTVVFIGTVAIGLTVFEVSEEAEVTYQDGRYVRASDLPPTTKPRRWAPQPHVWTHKRDMPSGRLCVRASSPYSVAKWERRWQERKGSDLSSKVVEIARELEADAVTIAALVAEGERLAEIERQRWKVQHEKWQAEEEERRRVEKIKESRTELFAVIEAWGRAKQLEDFFEDAEARARTLEPEEREAALDRLRRARALLGEVDALRRLFAWRSPEER